MGIRDFDRWWTAKIRRLPQSLNPLMQVLSFVGEPWVVLVIGTAGLLSATIQNNSVIERVFIYSTVAYLLNIILKLALHRRRPHGRVIKTFGIRSYSLPSGHAFGTVIFYGQYAHLDLKYLSHPWNVVAAVIIGCVIFNIGISRVYLGSHYPSDVLAGWLLGAVSLGAVIWLAF